ncbi:hypothetical protein RDI58_014943 [Solanum bulbocastanum]|uniref:WAT1-related protein n=1 Tax=Solanum bulbocastanum TaxID=147425 RepID=A0AAN8YEH2_SOLBU
MVNTITALTFILTVILRLKAANIRNPKGIAKVLGTLVSLAGVMSMTLYKGPVVKCLGHPLIYIHRGNGVVHENWSKGLILIVASCITWSIWYIMQKGPVFVTVSNPLSTILVAVLAYFILREKLYMGRLKQQPRSFIFLSSPDRLDKSHIIHLTSIKMFTHPNQ